MKRMQWVSRVVEWTRFASIYLMPPKVRETRFKIRSDILFFLLCLFSVFSFTNCKQKGNNETAETGSASCCQARQQHCFYFVITLRPANDSLTRVNVKFVLLRWLNLWSVLLDGMYARWHLQQSKLFTIKLKSQRWLKNLSTAEKKFFLRKTTTMISILGQWLIVDRSKNFVWKSNIARRKLLWFTLTLTSNRFTSSSILNGKSVEEIRTDLHKNDSSIVAAVHVMVSNGM